jgi:hypothetical protein
MEQRVLALGGTMHVDSTPGRGVTISIEVPLTAAVLAPEESPALGADTQGADVA